MLSVSLAATLFFSYIAARRKKWGRGKRGQKDGDVVVVAEAEEVGTSYGGKGGSRKGKDRIKT